MDSGSLGSLVHKEIVENAKFDMILQRKPTKWESATGVFQTDGSVIIEQYCLPQFTKKCHIMTSFTGVFQTDGTVIIEQYLLPHFTRKRHIMNSFLSHVPDTS